MKKALITGILGQDGPYLAKLLLGKGYEIYGLIMRDSKPDYTNTDYLGITAAVNFIPGELTDEASVREIIEKIKPDEIYNFAAISFVPASWEKPKLATEVNALGVLYFLDAIKEFVPKAKFFQASSGTMFGNNNIGGYQTEETPFSPQNPYAISKLYAYWMVRNYRESYDIFACNGILYNHESPLRGLEFVTRKIARGVAEIKLGLSKEIKLGNLESKRDWGFAGDYVEAIWLMLQQEKADDYIIATGECHSIRDFLREAFNHVGIADWEKHIATDAKFFRPVESDVLLGKPEKIKRTLNWQPKVKFGELVSMMVDADLERLKNDQK